MFTNKLKLWTMRKILKMVRDKLRPFIMSNYWFDFIIVMEVSIEYKMKQKQQLDKLINRKTVSIIVYVCLFVCLFVCLCMRTCTCICMCVFACKCVRCDNCLLKVFSCGRITIVVRLINTMQRFTTKQMNWQSHIVYAYIHDLYIRTDPNLCYISSSLIFFLIFSFQMCAHAIIYSQAHIKL